MNTTSGQLKAFHALIAFRKGMLNLKTEMTSTQFSITEREFRQVADLISSIDAELIRRMESMKTLKTKANSEQKRIREAIECRKQIAQDYCDILGSDVCNTLNATLLETLESLREELSHWEAIKTLSTSGEPDSTKAAESKPDSTKAAESKPDSTKVADSKPDSTKVADSKPDSTKAADIAPSA